MLAYNLMRFFQHIGLNQRKNRTLKTLKAQCFAIGTWTSEHARKKVLKLSLPRKKRSWMDAIFRNIEELIIPIQLWSQQ